MKNKNRNQRHQHNRNDFSPENTFSIKSKTYDGSNEEFTRKINGNRRKSPNNDTHQQNRIAPAEQQCVILIPKGLPNLGNTCFFNSTMQCLLNTHLLSRYFMLVEQRKAILMPIQESSNEKSVKNDNNDNLMMAEIQLTPQKMPLHLIFRKFFMDEFYSGRQPCSRQLFNLISSRVQRFRGGNQQDAHELLRYFLDLLHQEECRHFEQAFNDHFDSQLENGPEKKEQLQKLRNQCRELLKGPARPILETLFGGTLQQSIACSRCHSIFRLEEPFFDLSLPLHYRDMSKAHSTIAPKIYYPLPTTPRHAEQHENGENENGMSRVQDKMQQSRKKQNPIHEKLGEDVSTKTPAKLSKHQQKKLKKEVHKQKLQEAKKRNKRLKSVSIGPADDVEEKQEEKNEDVPEDEENDIGRPNDGSSEMHRETILANGITSGNEEEDNVKIIENGIEKQSTNENRTTNWKEENDVIIQEEPTVKSEHNHDEEEEKEDFINDAQEEKEKLALDVTVKEEYGEDVHTGLIEDSNAVRPLIKLEEVIENVDLHGNISVEGALWAYTQAEKLDALVNGYRCENCEKEAKAAGKPSGQLVTAFKRYLVQRPPLILTLHLQRYEQTGSGRQRTTRKFNGHVRFPLLLDLAPYCIDKVERIRQGQRNILYSLYGVVCHSGGMSGGHYIAYIRARPQQDPKQLDKLFQQVSSDLPSMESSTEELQNNLQKISLINDKNTENGIDTNGINVNGSGIYLNGDSTDNCNEEKNEENSARQQHADSLHNSQWYYCSDSCVRPASQGQVLAAQAYLLFYERIY